MKETNKAPFNPDDVYGILEQELEVDSDVNEDRFREKQLDASLETFLEQLEKKK